MPKKWFAVAVLVLALAFLGLFVQNAMAVGPSGTPTNIRVGVLLVNVEKVDLSANSYRLDFYLWFTFNPLEISLEQVKDFEFVNGAPTKYVVYENETQGYLEYRVRGDFIRTFDFTRYPFEAHELAVELEHKNFNISRVVFEEDPTSYIEETANVAGWNLEDFQISVTEHAYGEDTYSRFVFSVTLKRPTLSSFIKSVLPISVITAISLLAFFISPQNFAQRIGLGVTTLLSATAFHLSLISGIPPTGYLTLADRMMLSIYTIFLYNLSASVYIMKLVDSKKPDEAAKFNRKALRFLPILIITLIIIQALL
ncbi:MAG: hypothetical protein ACQXXH_08440 [Candidatus Bathyarchaeia archaeon]|nr:hypothetical protein [Candidatus Bathyarchaeota archaeon A05DMB-4]MDH7595195.1 hypothetical protein [Candidatus Bathyarchaeota archaeon]